MADRKVSALTELSVTPATGDLFHIVDISEAADADKNKKITWGTIDAAIDTIIAANNSGFLVAASDLSDVASAATARTNLGVAIGTDVQAYDAGLADIAGLAVTDGNIIVGDGANWVAENGATARTSLGLAIGTNVQAWDDDLDDIAALTPTKGNLLAGNGTDWIALGVGTDTQVLTADSAEASGIKWAAGGGGSSLPVADTTSIVEGSADATKEIRIEVDGLTTSTVRVWTAQDADLTVAGTDVAQSFSALQSFTGTGHAGLRLNNLTTAQRDALTPAEGDLIANTTTNNAEYYNGTSWDDLTGAGGGGSSTLADIATNSTTTAHQTFALDAATKAIFENSSGTDIFTIDETSGHVGIGTATADSDFHVINNDSTTNAIVDLITISKNTTGTPAIGMGAGIHFELETVSNQNEDAGGMSVELLSANGTTWKTKGELYLYSTSTRLVPITYSATSSSVTTVGITGTTTISGSTEISGSNSNSKFVVKNNVGAEAFRVGTNPNAVTINTNLDIPANLTVSGAASSGKFLVELSGAEKFKISTSGSTITATDLDITQRVNHNANSTVRNGYTYKAKYFSSGGTSAGFGEAIRFQLESSTTQDRDAGRILWKWTTATDASRAAEGALTAYYTSTEETPIRWGADSSGETLGFYNTSPISQPSGTGETTGFTAGAGTGVNDDSTFTGNVGATAYRISDIVQHLKNLGLIAQ